MKKIVLVLAVLVFTATAMAEPNNITITAAQIGSTAEVEITYTVTSGKIPRAFALDVTVTAGNIVGIGNFFAGDNPDDVNKGFGIFPSTFASTPIDPEDPNWEDPNYTPEADPCDLPGGTQLGIDSNGITIELGSLYDIAEPNRRPATAGTLCSIYVDTSCHVDLGLNPGRSGIVMEDGNQPDGITLTECDVTLVQVCIVPDVLGDTNAIAQAAIDVDFTVGTITTACSDTVADGNVISTDPAAGAEPGCDADVNMVVSTGSPTVPDVIGDSNAVAQAAIIAVSGLSVGNITTDCNDSIAAGNVISTNPAAGATTCGTAVDIVVSTGCCPVDVPNIVGMLESAAETAVTNAGCTVGTQTYVWNNDVNDCTVTAQAPTACTSCVPCGTAVNMTIARNWSYPASWDFLAQCRGDATGEGECGVLDFYELRDAWDRTHPHADYLAHSGADFDRDGYVGILDFYILRDNWDTFPTADCNQGDPNGTYKPAAPPTGGGC